MITYKRNICRSVTRVSFFDEHVAFTNEALQAKEVKRLSGKLENLDTPLSRHVSIRRRTPSQRWQSARRKARVRISFLHEPNFLVCFDLCLFLDIFSFFWNEFECILSSILFHVTRSNSRRYLNIFTSLGKVLHLP